MLIFVEIGFPFKNFQVMVLNSEVSRWREDPILVEKEQKPFDTLFLSDKSPPLTLNIEGLAVFLFEGYDRVHPQFLVFYIVSEHLSTAICFALADLFSYLITEPFVS